MKNSFITPKLIAALAVGTLAGAAIGILFGRGKEGNTRRKIANEAKDLAKDLKKIAQRKAKSLNKEEWLDKEKEKIMNHVK